MFRREVLKGVLGVAAVPAVGEKPTREIGRLLIQFNAAWRQKTADPGVLRRLTIALLGEHDLQPSTDWIFWVSSTQTSTIGIADGIELRTDKLYRYTTRASAGLYVIAKEPCRMTFCGVPV